MVAAGSMLCSLSRPLLSVCHCDCHAMDAEGATPLHLAAAAGGHRFVADLLAGGSWSWGL